jgi:TonB family protein
MAVPLLFAIPGPVDPRARVRRDARRLLVAVPLGLAAHGLLVALIVAGGSLRPPKPPRAASRPVSLRPISAARWATNRGAVARDVPERPAPLHPKGQVVDVAPGNNRVAADAKYLAETNNQVQRETRAREQTSTWSRATPKNTPNPTAQPAAKGRAAPQQETAGAPGLLSSILGRRPFRPLLDHPAQGSGEAVTPTEDPVPVGTEQGTQAVGGDLTEGGGAPNDALNQLPAGDGTFLNTREWKYAGFFNRVKQAVSARWDPNGRLRARNRQLGFDDRVTVVQVALRPDGSLAEVFVAKPSGLDDLDQEAMRSFEKAQPFANPPQALVEHGLIRFSFGFTVTSGDLGGGGTPRFLRFGR